MTPEELKEIERLKQDELYWRCEANRLSRVLESETKINKALGEENSKLRDHTMMVRRYFPESEFLEFRLSVRDFYSYPEQTRNEYLQHVLIDAMRCLLDRAAGRSYLEEFRRKISDAK